MAEKKPPNFHRNTMNAMYRITQEDAPRLNDNVLDEQFREFTHSMLQKNPCDRPSASQLLSHIYLSRKFSENFLSDILYECAEKVAKYDQTAYKKFKKIISDTDDISPSSSDKSKSTEADLISSENDSLEIQTFAIQSNDISKNIGSDSDHPTIKINTIKSAPNIIKEMAEYKKESYLHIKEYQAIRKNNNKQLKLLEQKLDTEFNDLIKTHKKNLENVKITSEKNLRSLQDRFQLELNVLQRQYKSDSKRTRKTLKVTSPSFGDKLSMFDTFLSFPVINLKKSSKITSREPETNASSTNNSFLTPRGISLQNTSAEPLYKLKSKYLEDLEILKNRYVLEKLDLLKKNRELYGKKEIQSVHIIFNSDIDRINQIYMMKNQHIIKLHNFENESQKLYVSRKTSELDKKHMRNLKYKPKEYKLIENRVTKIYKEIIKNLQNEYHETLKMSLEKAPKDQHPIIKNRLRNEKMTRILALKTEMDSNIFSEINNDKIRLNEFQSKEKEELRNILLAEYQSLVDYQTTQTQQSNQSKEKDVKNISDKYESMLKEIELKIQSDIEAIKSQLNNIEFHQNDHQLLEDEFVRKLNNLILTIVDSDAKQSVSLSNSQI